jgi:hypothetical protein
MLKSPRSPPLDLESDWLRLSGAIAQQSHYGDSKPQQHGRHEGERYKQVVASGDQSWPRIVCSSQKQGT